MNSNDSGIDPVLIRHAREHKRLYEILDRDPELAVIAARDLQAADDLDEENVELLRACIFVDGGAELADARLISEGIQKFRASHEKHPQRIDAAYNLANGLRSLAQTNPTSNRSWYLVTADLRREARQLYQSVIGASDYSEFHSRAHTNQANLLAQSFRWVEAYDSYRAALQFDPANGIASSGIVKLLNNCIDRGIGDANRLNKLAAKYTRVALESESRSRELGGERALEALRDLLSHDLPDPKLSDLPEDDPYAKFVSENRLALSLTLEGLDPHIRHWDPLRIRSITEDIDTDHGVPPIFAMWNVLKSDFLAARWLAHQADSGAAPESGWYSDSLDYAKYGIHQSLWALAQRSGLDILDRIAVATTEYLNIREKYRSIYFRTRWHQFEKRKMASPPRWQPDIAAEIGRGNHALIALSEIAEDINMGGYLNPKRTLRNSSTHSFVVLHDEGISARFSKHVKHFDETDFHSQTIESLQLARSALFYFVEMIELSETRKASEPGKTGELHVPSHHWIRGEEP